MKLWECVWAAEFSTTEPLASGAPRDGLSDNLSLFVALAVLETHRDSTMRYLEHFDEVLQYMNGLSGHIDVEEAISQSEVLVLALRRLFEEDDASNASLPETSSDGRQTRESSNVNGPTLIHTRLANDSQDLRSLVF